MAGNQRHGFLQAAQRPAGAAGGRDAKLSNQAPAYDAVVVGGGITGAGVARDLARRGVSVLLLEKGDYGGATTGASSWLLHGGTRYLGFDWETTRLSCLDAGKIVEIARHMVHRVLFLFPVLPDSRYGIERLETLMEVYDRLQPLKHSHSHIRLDAREAQAIEPGLSLAVLGAVTMEEWGVDPLRLTFANVQDAVAHGAVAFNHAEVEQLIRSQGRVIGVTYRRYGAAFEARAKVVVNAAGPWAAGIAALAGQDVRLRPTKGVHIVFDRRLSNFALSVEAIDGRSLLMVPTGGFTVLGTTDDDFYGDLDSPDVSEEEVDYLLQGFESTLPSIRSYRRLRATSGVRPTLFQAHRDEDVLSRRFAVFDHSRNGLQGFVSIAGGKLSMYRVMAEATADAVCRQLGVGRRSDTAVSQLPGNDADLEAPAGLARRHGLPVLAVARLQTRHGTEAEKVLGAASSRRVVCRCEQVTEAELVNAVRHEQASELADAFRRVGLAAGPCTGAACLGPAADVMGGELGWSPAQRNEAAEAFRRQLWRGRAPVLDRWGWAEEELAYAASEGHRV